MNFILWNVINKKYSWIKIENRTVTQLKAIAKERGIRGYYNLRKAELMRVLEATKLVEQKRNIFDEPIPNDPTPVLQPNPWRQSMSRRKLSKILKIYLLKVCKRLKILVNGCWITYHQNKKWLRKCLSRLKNKINKIYEKRDSLFQPAQTKSHWKFLRFSIE